MAEQVQATSSRQWKHDPSFDVWVYEPYEGSSIWGSFKTFEEAVVSAESIVESGYKMDNITITGGSWVVS